MTGASSLSTDSVDGPSSSTDLTLDEPLESWLERREKRRDSRRREELRPSISGPSGAGLGGSEFSGRVLLLYLLWEEELGMSEAGSERVIRSWDEWTPEKRFVVLPLMSPISEGWREEEDARWRLSREVEELGTYEVSLGRAPSAYVEVTRSV